MSEFKSSITKLIAKNNDVLFGHDLTLLVSDAICGFFLKKAIAQKIFSSEEDKDRCIGVALYLEDGNTGFLEGFSKGVDKMEEVNKMKELPKVKLLVEDYRLGTPVFEAENLQELDLAIDAYVKFWDKHISRESGELELAVRNSLRQDIELTKEIVGDFKEELKSDSKISGSYTEEEINHILREKFGCVGSDNKGKNGKGIVLPFNPEMRRRK
jgi:hypothetical protein